MVQEEFLCLCWKVFQTQCRATKTREAATGDVTVLACLGHVSQSAPPPQGWGVCDKAGKQLTLTEVFLELIYFRILIDRFLDFYLS